MLISSRARPGPRAPRLARSDRPSRVMYRAGMTWEPVLDGELAEEARAAVRAIAEDLERLEPARRLPIDEALLWAYVAGAFDDARAAGCFEAAVAALYERIEAPFTSHRLHGGLAGAGW